MNCICQHHASQATWRTQQPQSYSTIITPAIITSLLTLLDSAGDDGASAGDGEGVLDGHQEGLLRLSRGGGDVRLHL